MEKIYYIGVFISIIVTQQTNGACLPECYQYYSNIPCHQYQQSICDQPQSSVPQPCIPQPQCCVPEPQPCNPQPQPYVPPQQPCVQQQYVPQSQPYVQQPQPCIPQPQPCIPQPQPCVCEPQPCVSQPEPCIPQYQICIPQSQPSAPEPLYQNYYQPMNYANCYHYYLPLNYCDTPSTQGIQNTISQNTTTNMEPNSSLNSQNQPIEAVNITSGDISSNSTRSGIQELNTSQNMPNNFIPFAT